MLSQTFTWKVLKLVDHLTKKITLGPKFQQHTPQKSHQLTACFMKIH